MIGGLVILADIIATKTAGFISETTTGVSVMGGTVCLGDRDVPMYSAIALNPRNIYHYKLEEPPMTITDPIVEQPTAAVVMERELRTEITQLRGQLVLANEQLEFAHHDLEYIASRLHDKAEEKDWCDEYDQFKDDVNRNTHGDWLVGIKRSKDFSVTVIVTVQTSDIDDTFEELAETAREYASSLGDERPVINVSLA